MGIERCDLGLIHCSHPAVEECSTCGRFFCAIHGSVDKGVCRSCLASRLARDAADAVRAKDLAEREEAAIRNDHDLCGAKDCESSSLVRYCQRCANWFCDSHIRMYSYSTTVQSITGRTRLRQEIALCQHCAPHLRDYEREEF